MNSRLMFPSCVPTTFVPKTVSRFVNTSIACVFFFGFVSVGFADYASEVDADNPIAYWQFNETSGTTMIDSSGNGNNGSYLGLPVLGQPGAGFGTGTSVLFDGVNDYASATIPLGQSFTAECWAKSANDDWNRDGWLASSRGTNGFILHPDSSTRNTRGFVYGENGSPDFRNAGGGTVADIQQFHHYALTYDYDLDQAVFYIDGQAVSTTPNVLNGLTRVGDPNIPDISVWIGRDQFNDSPLRYGNAWVDEMAIYGTALSPERLQAHYNAATVPEPAGSTLILLAVSAIMFRRSRRK
jgi:hypothetical protein